MQRLQPLIGLSLSHYGAGLGIALLAAALALPAGAAATPREPLVITISYVPRPADTSSAQVTTLTEQQIKVSHSRGVTELLQQVPGVIVEQNSGGGGFGAVYLRGGDPNFTVVLIDGVAVNNPTNSRGGSFDFSTLNAADVERIEIAQGPLSAVHGSGALSGVINIITRRGGNDPRTNAELSTGNRGYSNLQASSSGALNKGDYRLTAAHRDEGALIEGAQHDSRLLSASIGYQPAASADLRLSVRATHSDHEAFPDDSGGPRYALFDATDERRVDEQLMHLGWEQRIAARWRVAADWSVYHSDDEFVSPGVAPGLRDPAGIPPNQAQNDYLRRQFDLRNEFAVSPNAGLIIGASISRERGDTQGSLDLGGFLLPSSFDLERGNHAVYAESLMQPTPQLSLQAVLRRDMPDGFAARTIPKLGVTYAFPDSGTTLRANWGKGFKLPSFYALGHPIVGNPELKPERSLSRDISLTQKLFDERTEISLTLFHNRFLDLIDLQETPVLQLVNRAEVITQGVQVALRHTHNRAVSTRLHVDYLDTDIRDSDEELRNRPTWKAGLGMTWQISQTVGLNADANYTGEVHDSSIPTGDLDRAAYTRIDVAADWQATTALGLFVAIDNLFDAEYEDAVGFPAPGTLLRAGLRYDL